MSILSRLFPRWRSENYALGIGYFNRREFGLAVEQFEVVLQETRDPSNPEVELARFYAAESRTKLGLAAFQAADFTRARHEFEQAARVEGNFPDLYYFLGVLSVRDGRIDDALLFLDRALELNPNFIEALACRALIAESMGETPQADEDLARVTALSVPVADPAPYQIRRPPAVHVLPELSDPDEAEALLVGALAAYDRGRLFESLAAMESLIAARPEYADLRWRYGQILSEMNRREEALAAFDDALQVNPNFLSALLARSLCLLTLRRSTDAHASLQKAAGLRPGYADVAYYQGVAALRAGRPVEALPALARALDLNPRFWRARFVMGQVQLTLGRRAEGIQELRTALDNQPSLHPERCFGPVYPDRGGYEDAVGYLSNAVACHPEYPDLRVQLGLAYLDAGRIEAAQEEFRTATRLNPDYARAHCHLGQSVVRAGRPDQAVPHLARTVDLEPAMADVHCLLAEALLAAGERGAAETSFQRALGLNPGYVNAILGLATVHRLEGRSGEARGLYRKALEIAPGHPVASAKLVWVTTREQAGGEVIRPL